MIKRELEFESLAQNMGCYVCGPLATLSLLKIGTGETTRGGRRGSEFAEGFSRLSRYFSIKSRYFIILENLDFTVRFGYASYFNF